LHTPGGDLAATESIVDYLHKMFGNDIRAIIPQLAMSAGTMIACSCKEILMGKQSNLGPIDPQFGGIPAHGVLKEFEEAIAAVKEDPASTPIWQIVVSKYHPTFIGECRHALRWSTKMVQTWLECSMFQDERKAKSLAKKAVDYLGDHDHTKSHARHIPVEEAEKLLKVIRLEDDGELQDLVLTVHHSFMHTFANSQAVKIVENHIGSALISRAK
jgi:membrane-bound ClpP family serine protease